MTTKLFRQSRTLPVSSCEHITYRFTRINREDRAYDWFIVIIIVIVAVVIGCICS
jgi:hypothetical protein